MGNSDRYQAYLAFRAVMYYLRDRLTTEEAARLGAQLLMLIRGFYYEVRPHRKVGRRAAQGRLLRHIPSCIKITRYGEPNEAPEQVARAVFRELVW